MRWEAEAFVTSLTGSAPATVAALGRIMYPELIAAGYRERFALGLIVSSAETALLIPPSITLIIYGWLTGTSITGLFAGGLVIGIFLALAFSAYVELDSLRSGRAGSSDPRPWHPGQPRRTSGRRERRSWRCGAWGLLWGQPRPSPRRGYDPMARSRMPPHSGKTRNCQAQAAD